MTPYLNFRRTHWSEHRPWLLLAGLVAIGTTLAGCAGASTAPVPVVMPTAPASATVTLCDSSTPSCGGVSTFSLSSIRDLSIAVSWQNVSQGTHSQTLGIVLPDGNLYQAMEMSFEIPNGSSGAATTAQSLPVVGTWITQRRLTGTWNISVSLDDRAIATNSVQLTP